MDGWEEKLGALFSSPESMAQLKQLADTLAGTLGGGGGDRSSDPERGRRLDKALRIARLTRAARTAIPELGMRR